VEPRASELIGLLNLEPHPEGGYYREIWRSGLETVPADGRGTRPALTLIHFLLPAGAVSRWHRVRSDEVWHPLILVGVDLVAAWVAVLKHAAT
jgi:predicted cupin superfamily sugar epimerase